MRNMAPAVVPAGIFLNGIWQSVVSESCCEGPAWAGVCTGRCYRSTFCRGFTCITEGVRSEGCPSHKEAGVCRRRPVLCSWGQYRGFWSVSGPHRLILWTLGCGGLFRRGLEGVSRVLTRKLDGSCTQAAATRRGDGATFLRGPACLVVQELCVFAVRHSGMCPCCLCIQVSACYKESWQCGPVLYSITPPQDSLFRRCSCCLSHMLLIS